jgi:signal transduction histidine kinase
VDDVAPAVLHELYYIGREAISNAFRHAEASEITVSLNCGPTSVVLVVTDNGCGFDPVAQETDRRTGHWGLQGMRERAEVVGARFECRSTEKRGTEIVVTVLGRRGYKKNSGVGQV